MSSTRIAPIQWLRALAATLVLLIHALDSAKSGLINVTGEFAPSIPNLAVFGASGVDLFFVISGFVMAQSLSNADRNPWDFLAKRWLRIVPLFACLSVVYMMIMHDPLTRVSTLMSITVLPILDTDGYHAPALYPGWTLGFEFAFYMLVAIAMRAPRYRVEALLASTIAVAVTGGFVHPSWAPARILLNPLQLEFALGVLVWLAWRKGFAERIAAPSLVIGIALLAVGLTFGMTDSLDVSVKAATAGISGYGRTWTWGIPWALVVLGVIDTAPRGRFERILSRVGDASYSTYLIHPSVIALLWMVRDHIPTKSVYVFSLAFIVASTMLGLAVHRWIEQPLLARLQRRLPVSIRRAPALA